MNAYERRRQARSLARAKLGAIRKEYRLRRAESVMRRFMESAEAAGRCSRIMFISRTGRYKVSSGKAYTEHQLARLVQRYDVEAARLIAPDEENS